MGRLPRLVARRLLALIIISTISITFSITITIVGVRFCFLALLVHAASGESDEVIDLGQNEFLDAEPNRVL